MSGLPKQILNSSRGANAGTFTDDTPSKYYRWSEMSFAGGSYTPRPGDLILWAWDRDSHQYDESLGHTSIFNRAVDHGSTITIYTIDGNNGGCTGGLYGPMPVAEKQGSRFVGWFTKPEGGKRVNIYTPVRRETDETLFAHYE